MTTTDLRVDEGYAPATGEVGVYWRSLGEGGTPLVAVHGGFGVVEAFGDVLDRLATGRRVVAVELQGHGHTADVDRSEEHTSELQSRQYLVCRLLLEKKKP